MLHAVGVQEAPAEQDLPTLGPPKAASGSLGVLLGPHKYVR